MRISEGSLQGETVFSPTYTSHLTKRDELWLHSWPGLPEALLIPRDPLSRQLSAAPDVCERYIAPLQIEPRQVIEPVADVKTIQCPGAAQQCHYLQHNGGKARQISISCEVTT